MSAARAVIYDDDCGFCKRSVAAFRALDWFGRLEWAPRSSPETARRFPQASRGRTAGEMVSVAPDGSVSGGFYAVRDILVLLPAAFLPALLLYVPGVSLAGVPVYRWIARNRHRFAATSCSTKK